MKVLQDEYYASATQASRATKIIRFWKKKKTRHALSSTDGCKCSKIAGGSQKSDNGELYQQTAMATATANGNGNGKQKRQIAMAMAMANVRWQRQQQMATAWQDMHGE